MPGWVPLVMTIAAGAAIVPLLVVVPATSVELRTAAPAPIATSDEVATSAPGDALGVVLAEQAATIAAPGGGTLVALHARLGDRVAAGAPLASLDTRALRREEEAAAAALRTARAEEARLAGELEQARTAHGRIAPLAGVVADEVVDEAAFVVRGAEARLRAAGAAARERGVRLAQARGELAVQELRAPFAGVVAAHYADEHATLAAGSPVLRLIGDARLVRFAAEPGLAAALRVGDRVCARGEAGEAVAEVVRVAPEVDAASQLAVVEARVSTGAERLAVGAAVRVTPRCSE